MANQEKYQRYVDLISSHKSDIFFESGSYGGDGIRGALEVGFKEIHSVEIFDKRYKQCHKIFRKQKNVHLYHGDSATIMLSVLKQIPPETSITFWLDAHYSGKGTGMYNKECSPLRRELESIRDANRPSHDTILIDDARKLHTFGYSPPFDDLRADLSKINPNFKIHIAGEIGDFVRCVPSPD